MDGYQWFQVGQTVVTAVAGLLVLSIKVGLKSSTIERVSPRLDAIEKVILLIPLHGLRIDQLEARMQQAGGKVSDLASDVQGFPERMRRDFLPREEADLRHDAIEQRVVVMERRRRPRE